MSLLRRLVSKSGLLVVIFSLIVVLSQGASIFPNGTLDKSGNLVFYDSVLFRDSTVHLSLISEMEYRFPPTNFSAGGGALKNYHYLFDALLAAITKVTALPKIPLYYVIVPVLISLGLVSTVYYTTKRLTNDRLVAAFAIFFVVFTTSLGSLLPLIKMIFNLDPLSVTAEGNAFMTDQLLGMMVNPQGVVSLIIYLSMYLLLAKYLDTKKPLLLLLFAGLLAISFGVKAYGGIVFAGAALLASLWHLWKKRDYKVFIATIFGITAMALWVASTIDGKVAGVKFAPFWLIEKMVGDLTRLNEPRFILLAEHYRSLGKFFHLALLTAAGTAVYLVGSLGIRIVGLTSVASKRRFSPAEVFLYLTALFSLVIPLFFNQSSKAYDIVQFTTYFTLFMGIMFTISLFSLLRKISSPSLRYFILTLVVIGVVVLNRQELSLKFTRTNDQVKFSPKTIEAVNFVKTSSPPDAIFALEVNDFNRDYLWFSSLADRRTYYTGKRFAEQVGVNVVSEEEKTNLFLTGQKDIPEITHAFTSADNAFSVKIDDSFGFRRIYSNEEFVVFERTQ